MKIELENVKPRDIERRSFEIITEELGDQETGPGQRTDHQTLYPYKCRL